MSDLFYELKRVHVALRDQSHPVHSQKWQGVDISSKPEMSMHVLFNHTVDASLSGREDLDHYRRVIKPNLPWADDHFAERVCGQPINPGVEWENWPGAKSAESFLAFGKFNHNYMERYWPKNAGAVIAPTKFAQEYRTLAAQASDRLRSYDDTYPLFGIRYFYGDLDDVVNLLAKDPMTRQAFLPVWFPEDTGSHQGRRPCTLGYLFQVQGDALNIVYYIRSCDYVRHFRDDVYLTVRLLLWMIDRLRERDPSWNVIKPGRFIMHIANLHLFRNDWKLTFPEAK